MKKTGVIVGILLIVLGVAAFAVAMGWVYIRVWTVLSIAAVLLGVGLHVRFLVGGQKDAQQLLPGAILLVYGCLFFIWSTGSGYRLQGLWGLLFLGPGIGFLEMFLLGDRSRSNLIPAGILTSLGLATLVAGLPFAYARELFVPLLLLLAGVFTIVYACTPPTRRTGPGPGRNAYRAGSPGYGGINDPNMYAYQSAPQPEPQASYTAQQASPSEPQAPQAEPQTPPAGAQAGETVAPPQADADEEKPVRPGKAEPLHTEEEPVRVNPDVIFMPPVDKEGEKP